MSNVDLSMLNMLEWEEFLNRYSDRRFYVVDDGLCDLELFEIIKGKPKSLVKGLTADNMCNWMQCNLTVSLK